MPSVNPKLSTPPTPSMRRLLVDAGDGARKADAELRQSVKEALSAGVSVREVAALTDISTNTVQRWKKEAGL